MSPPRAAVAAALAWAAVVGVGSTAVWTVVSRVGDEVGAGGAAAPPAVTGATPVPAPVSASAAASGRTARARPGPYARVARTWQGPQGVVVVACRGAAASLVSAQPYEGWAVVVRARGPERAEVELVLGEGDDGDDEQAGLGPVAVAATCADGVPEVVGTALAAAGAGPVTPAPVTSASPAPAPPSSATSEAPERETEPGDDAGDDGRGGD